MTDPSLTISQIYQRELLDPSTPSLFSYPIIEVDNGFIISSSHGEFGSIVFWASRDCSESTVKYICGCPRDGVIFFLESKKPINARKVYPISHQHHIRGFIKTKIGILGFGGFSHMSWRDGYIVKFYDIGAIWKANTIMKLKSQALGCEETETGLKIQINNNDFVYD